MVLQNSDSLQTSEVAKVSEKRQTVEQMSSENVAGTSESNNLANSNMAANLEDGAIYSSNSMASSAPMNSNMSVAPNKPVPSLAEVKKDEARSENDLAAVNKDSEKFSLDGAKENQANQGFAEGLTVGRRNQRTQDDPRNSTPQLSANSNLSASNRQISELPVNDRQSAALQSSPATKPEAKKAKTSDAIENETTIVSGKTFKRRNNVWYDADYKQQSTINITRGTEKYKKLDKGLRDIVENLGGTVVVVWKDKAYRIQ